MINRHNELEGSEIFFFFFFLELLTYISFNFQLVTSNKLVSLF